MLDRRMVALLRIVSVCGIALIVKILITDIDHYVAKVTLSLAAALFIVIFYKTFNK